MYLLLPFKPETASNLTRHLPRKHPATVLKRAALTELIRTAENSNDNESESSKPSSSSVVGIDIAVEVMKGCLK